jgi:DNA-binding transcriptional MerR regulator
MAWLTSSCRDYEPAEADRLRLLLGLRQLDLPLTDAARLATLCADGRCPEVSDHLRSSLPARRAAVRRRIADLQHLAARLADLERHLADGDAPGQLINSRKEDDDV